jgi:hypothetical protein
LLWTGWEAACGTGFPASGWVVEDPADPGGAEGGSSAHAGRPIAPSTSQAAATAPISRNTIRLS